MFILCLSIFRKFLDNLVEKVTCSASVSRRDAPDVAESKGIELVSIENLVS